MGRSSTDESSARVFENADAGRWEARVGDGLAGFLAYVLRPGEVTLIHTEVDPAFEGRGIGSRLARTALEDARQRGIRVVPECPFVRAYLRRHPEYRDLVRRPNRTNG